MAALDRAVDPLARWGAGYEAACSGKAAYPSENGARAALAIMQRERLMRTGSGMDAYRCRYCGDWHLGHTGKGA